MTTDPDLLTARQFEAAIDRAKRLIASMPAEPGQGKEIAAAAAFIRAAASPPDALCSIAVAATELSGCVVTVRATAPDGTVAFYSADGLEVMPDRNSRLVDSARADAPPRRSDGGDMAKSFVRGGDKLRKFLRNAARSSRAPQATAEAGFLSPHIAGLAARLEFGDARTDLPERPAFRTAAPDAFASGSRIVAKSLGARVRDGVFAVDEADAQRAADAMAGVIRASYQSAHFAPLSERQEARKAGTPGAGRELVGHEGEKLIRHIRGRVRKGR